MVALEPLMAPRGYVRVPGGWVDKKKKGAVLINWRVIKTRSDTGKGGPPLDSRGGHFVESVTLIRRETPNPACVHDEKCESKHVKDKSMIMRTLISRNPNCRPIEEDRKKGRVVI